MTKSVALLRSVFFFTGALFFCPDGAVQKLFSWVLNLIQSGAKRCNFHHPETVTIDDKKDSNEKLNVVSKDSKEVENRGNQPKRKQVSAKSSKSSDSNEVKKVK